MQTQDKEQVRRTREPLEAALMAAGVRQIRGTAFKCPFHDDRHASGSIYRSKEDDVWRAKCHGCGFNGDVFDVQARHTHQPVGDLLKAQIGDRAPRARQPKIYVSIEAMEQSLREHEATYVYTNPDSKHPDLIVLRYRRGDGKAFIQARRLPSGGFVMESPGKPLPIYNRIRVAKSDVVWVVEGEKCVHALTELGYTATTSPGGAGKAAHADWSPLAGKVAVLWADNDDPDPEKGFPEGKGKAHMRDVATILHGLPTPARVLRVKIEDLGLPSKGDVVDFVQRYREQGWSVEEIRGAVDSVFEDADPLRPSQSLAARLEKIISGEWHAIPWPFEQLSRLTQALLPGTLTMICGDPSATKSYFLTQSLIWWLANGYRPAFFELEEDMEYWQQRLMAQLAGAGDLMDATWVRENPDAARKAFADTSDLIDRLTGCISVAPDQQLKLMDVADWIDRKAAEGFDPICVDPITAVESSKDLYVEDSRFVNRAKIAARKYGCRLVFVTHPKGKTGKSAGGFGEMARASDYDRFTQTILWVKRHEPKLEVKVKGKMGPHFTTINRTIQIRKARNGRGTGLDIGFNFGEGLLFAEQGVVLEEDPNA